MALALSPSFSIKNRTSAGSMSPVRVPIRMPGRGVKPMEVSTDWPNLTAAMLAAVPDVVPPLVEHGADFVQAAVELRVAHRPFPARLLQSAFDLGAVEGLA